MVEKGKASIWAAAALVGVSVAGADSASPPVAAAREMLAKWVETQQILSKEKRDWEQGRELLESRIEQVRGEIDALKQRQEELRGPTTEAETRRAETLRETRALDETGREMATWLAALEDGLRGVKPRLPEPLVRKVEPLFARMPSDAAATKISPAERLQNVVGILNETNKFNGEITMVNEVRTLSDGRPAEVRTVYVGLAQAYFVSSGGEAGIGRPGEDGWRWETAAALAPRVTEVVEILQNKAKPRFVALPVKVQ